MGAFNGMCMEKRTVPFSRPEVKKKESDFAGLAKKYSDENFVLKGGALGTFPRGEMAEAIEKTVFALKPGEISDILETQFGYQFFKLTDKKEARVLPFSEVMDNVKNFLKYNQTFDEVNEWVAEQKSQAKIEIIGSNK